MPSFRRLVQPAFGRVFLPGVFLLAACGDSSGPSTPRVASVAVTPPAANVVINTSVQLSATPRSSDGTAITGKAVVWSSLNNAVATVTNAGLVAGVSAGTVQINAAVDGIVGSATITVTPPPVAKVTIAPAAPAVNVGGTVQLSAVLRDAADNVLSGRTVTWSSGTPAVATINATTGVAQGVAAGTTLITATSEGVNGTATLTVVTPATITSITPDPLVPGATATITGTGFNATASGNIVTVGGFAAPVTASTTTTVTFTVPSGICLPSGNATVIVAITGAGNAQKTVPFQTTAAPVNVAAGQQVLISNPANFCLQLPANTATEAYLIGVQSISEVALELTPVVVKGTIPSTATPAPPVLPVAQLTSTRSTGLSPLSSKAVERWRRHRQAEQTFRAREYAAVTTLARQRPTMNLASAASAQTIPSAAKVGDTLDIKVPTAASCATSVPIRAIVRLIGRRSIWLEDIGNPTGGFGTADYQELADKMDNNIFTTDSAYFGNPTDLDQNQRIGIVVTKEINKIDNILGFTSSTDQFPAAQCSASNFAEIYYGIAVDPTGQYAFGQYTLRDAKLDAPVLLAHEMTHLIQFGRRIQSGASFFTLWEAEGQATLGEEVNGHKETGRAIAQNYGFNVAFNNPQTDSIYWYVASFVDLALYYGFNTQTSTIPGAPEECGWLGQQNRQNIGPCMGGRNIYGISWSFLRWLSDQFGPTFPGGEQGLQRQLINSNLQGFANITAVIQQPIDQLLAQWAAALYVDDRVTNAAARLKFTSWDLFNVENRLVTTAKLTPRPRGFSDFTDNVNVRAGSTAYFRVSGTNHGPMAISVAGAATQLPGTMRLWVVRLQ